MRLDVGAVDRHALGDKALRDHSLENIDPHWLGYVARSLRDSFGGAFVWKTRRD